MKKIGIFSGTFDPIHDGHLLFAEAAMQAEDLDEVVLLVQHTPWRKQAVAAFEERLEMAEIATELTGVIRVLDAEELEVGRTHTVQDTMAALEEHFEDCEFVLLLGGDAFEHIESWDGCEDLIQTTSFIVGLRSEDDGEIITPLIKKLGVRARVIVSPLPLVSSTKIREQLQSKQSPRGLDDDVLEYIHEHRLYT